MKEYSTKAFKLTYPDRFKVKGDYLCVRISDPRPQSTRFSDLKMFIGLEIRALSFDLNYRDRLDPARYEKHQVLRSGDYAAFPGAKEIFLKTLFSCDHLMFNWHVLIPLGQRCLTVSWMALHDDTDRSIPPDFTEFNELWAPIVESLKFDLEKIETLPDFPMVEKNWLKPSAKSRHFKKTFAPIGFIGLYDAEREFFDQNDEGWAGEVDEENVAAHFIKEDQRLILFTRGDEGLEVPVDFYLSAEEPALPGRWTRVIEGLIGVSSGRLAFGAEEPEVIIKLQPGVYRFRVHFGNRAGAGGEEYWHVHLWPGGARESNEVLTLLP